MPILATDEDTVITKKLDGNTQHVRLRREHQLTQFSFAQDFLLTQLSTPNV
jgi:hypothetical protein